MQSPTTILWKYTRERANRVCLGDRLPPSPSQPLAVPATPLMVSDTCNGGSTLKMQRESELDKQMKLRAAGCMVRAWRST